MEKLIETIKDCAFEVRKHLSQGHLESVYRKALIHELKSRGLNAIEEYPLNVTYKNVSVGDFRADIIVEGKVIIELKSVNSLSPIHEVQLVNYLTTTGIDHGLLINHGGERYRVIHKTREYKF